MTAERVAAIRPRLVVTFAGPDSSLATVDAPGVSAGQLALAAFLVSELARDVRSGELTRAALAELAPSASGTLADLVERARAGMAATDG